MDEYKNLIDKILSGKQLSGSEADKFLELISYATKAGNGELSQTDKATQGLMDMLQSYSAELNAATEKFAQSPRGKEIIADRVRQEKKGRLTEAASEGLALLTSGLELGIIGKNLQEAKRENKTIGKPTLPALPGESPAIKEALNLARERAYNPYSSAEVNALIGSQGLDTLKALQTAKQVSGGQASQYQAAAQDAIDRARFAKTQAAGTLMEGQRQAQDQFLNAAQAQSAETLQRAGLAQNLYQMQNRNYMFEKGLADAALSAQRGNMLTAIQNAEIRLPSAIGGGIARLYRKPTFSGMGAAVDNQDNLASQAINRLTNQQILNNDYLNTLNNVYVDNNGVPQILPRL